VTWYYGFLLLGFLAHQSRRAAEPQADVTMPPP
jgi:hypothetical protein